MLQAGRRVSRLAALAGNTRLGTISGVRGMADHATTEDIENKLKEKLAASHLEVIDTSGGCGASFNVMVVSPQFEGKNLLARHRMVRIYQPGRATPWIEVLQ